MGRGIEWLRVLVSGDCFNSAIAIRAGSFFSSCAVAQDQTQCLSSGLPQGSCFLPEGILRILFLPFDYLHLLVGEADFPIRGDRLRAALEEECSYAGLIADDLLTVTVVVWLTSMID